MSTSSRGALAPGRFRLLLLALVLFIVGTAVLAGGRLARLLEFVLLAIAIVVALLELRVRGESRLVSISLAAGVIFVGGVEHTAPGPPRTLPPRPDHRERPGRRLRRARGLARVRVGDAARPIGERPDRRRDLRVSPDRTRVGERLRDAGRRPSRLAPLSRRHGLGDAGHAALSLLLVRHAGDARLRRRDAAVCARRHARRAGGRDRSALHRDHRRAAGGAVPGRPRRPGRELETGRLKRRILIELPEPEGGRPWTIPYTTTSPSPGAPCSSFSSTCSCWRWSRPTPIRGSGGADPCRRVARRRSTSGSSPGFCRASRCPSACSLRWR